MMTRKVRGWRGVFGKQCVKTTRNVRERPAMYGERVCFGKFEKLVTLGSLRLGLDLLGEGNWIGFYPILSNCKVQRFVK